MAPDVPHAELYVPQRGRRQHLSTHQLTRTQTFDELRQLALGAQAGGGGQPTILDKHTELEHRGKKRDKLHGMLIADNIVANIAPFVIH